MYRYNLDLILTAPSVAYHVVTTNNKDVYIHNPAEFPDPSIIKELYEPWMSVNILVPQTYIGPIMEIATQRRAISKDSSAVLAWPTASKTRSTPSGASRLKTLVKSCF